MKNIRIFVLKYNLTVVMSLIFLFFSCGKKEKAIQNIKKDNLIEKSDYTDKDVFNAVMFMEGPLSEKLAEFKDISLKETISDQKTLEKISIFQKAIVDSLSKADPKYFSEFRTQVGSGDYELVKAAVNNAVNKITEITLKYSGQTREEADEVALQFASVLEKEFNITNKSTHEEISKQMPNIKEYNRNIPSLYYYKTVYYWAYGVVLLAIMIVAVLRSTFENHDGNYVAESYLSTITAEFKKI